MKCSCHPDSPFHWQQNPRPSMFQADVNFRASKTGQTLSQASSANIEKIRSEGKSAGFLAGISKNREAELLRMRTFTTYTKAVLTRISKVEK